MDKKIYKCTDQVIFRTPIFAQNKCFCSNDNILFKKFIESKSIREAIFLASPILYRELEQVNNPKIKRDRLLNITISLFKYYTRMCTRCTPFGIFAGCGIGDIGENSKIILSNVELFRSCTRLDMDFLCALIKNITQKESIKNQSLYYPNNSLYESGQNLRYIDYTFSKNRRKYTLSQVEKTEYLQEVLQKAKQGAILNDLVNLLIDDDIEIDEAKEYINELIDNQILVSELEPQITGDESLIVFIKKLNKFDGVKQIIASLEKILKLLKSIDDNSVGRSLDMYDNIRKEIKKNEVQYDEKYLFQSDLFIKSKQATIDKNIVDSVYKGIAVLNRLTPKYENVLLKKFKEDFYKKYEEEEVPLVMALDVETGVGFGNIDGQRGDITPLLNDLFFPMQKSDNQEIKISQAHMMLNRKYDEFLKDDSTDKIYLKSIDLESFSENWDDLPDTMSTMVEVIHTEECPNGSLISMKNAGGASAANLLGRFCYLDKKIHDYVANIVKKEQELNPDKILAEIIHLPESRTGNILMRPILRDYEIPYLANPSVEKNKVIPITDLMISVKQGRYIKLRSKRLDKEVLPRLSSAHNFSNNSLPIYNFLCSLQTQGIRGGISFSWGSILEAKPFLPQVRYENIILSPALWNITPDDIKLIPRIDDKYFIDKVLEFKNKRKIPDKVLLVKGDNKLLIDFNHKLSIQMLFSEVKKNSFRLEEFLFDEQYPVIKREKETFTNQVVFSFYKKKENE